MDSQLIKLEDELAKYPGQWFVINSQTGHEEKVKNDLLEKIKNQKLENLIFDVRIFKYKTETKTGKTTEKNKFPGYIFINMHMTEAAWFIVRNTPGVTGFIGSSGRGAKPFPLTDEEVVRMLVTKEETLTNAEPEKEKNKATSGPDAKEEKVLFEADFKEGENVIILEGPFGNKEGKVIDMDYYKGIAIVSIEMFGRYTPTEVEFSNLKPVREY